MHLPEDKVKESKSSVFGIFVVFGYKFQAAYTTEYLHRIIFFYRKQLLRETHF